MFEMNASTKRHDDDLSEEEIERLEQRSANIVRREIEDVFIPDIEIERLTDQYSVSLVHDFGDEYHYSKEKREELQQRYEKLYQYNRKRTKCPKLGDYVRQFRLAIEIIDEIAETNQVYPPKEFKRLVFKKKIVIGGLNFPVFVGKRKKLINWDYIMKEYILNTETDPDELDIKPSDIEEEVEDNFEEKDGPIYDENGKEIPESALKEYDELDLIEIVSEPDKENEMINEANPKSIKQLNKLSPAIGKVMKEQIKAQKKSSTIRSYGTQTEDTFEFMQELDNLYDKKKKKTPDASKALESSAAYKRFMHDTEQYERETSLVEYNGRYYTMDDIEEIELKRMLERDNWNLRKLNSDKEERKEAKKKNKADKKRMKKLKKMIAELQDKKESRDAKIKGLPQGINAEELKKKKGKKSKKKHKTDIDKMTELMMNASGKKKGYKDHKKDMEDFTWGK